MSDQAGYHPWIGASDGGAEGVWRWVDNRQFWQGAANGTPVGNEYANWNAGEPNDFGTGEDYAQLNPFDDDGEWNDLNSEARLASFIVEWKPINPTELPGDYNRNGVVDAADYVLWRKTLNQIVANRADGADGNANGVIDEGDYEYWRARFGNVVPIPGRGADASAVPEPSAVVLMLFAFAIPSPSRRHIRPGKDWGKLYASSQRNPHPRIQTIQTMRNLT